MILLSAQHLHQSASTALYVHICCRVSGTCCPLYCPLPINPIVAPPQSDQSVSFCLLHITSHRIASQRIKSHRRCSAPYVQHALTEWATAQLFPLPSSCFVPPRRIESLPPCAIGPSSPCHPLHREPCDSLFGTSLESRLATTGGPAAAATARRLTNHLVALFPLFLPLQLCAFHRPGLRSLSARFPSFASHSLSAAASNHQLISVSPVASAPAPGHLLASCTARRGVSFFLFLAWAVDANSARFLCLHFALLAVLVSDWPSLFWDPADLLLASLVRLAIHDRTALSSRLAGLTNCIA